MALSSGATHWVEVGRRVSIEPKSFRGPECQPHPRLLIRFPDDHHRAGADQLRRVLDRTCDLLADIVANRHRPLRETLDVFAQARLVQADITSSTENTTRLPPRMMNRLRSNSDGPTVKLDAEMTTNARPTAGAVARVPRQPQRTAPQKSEK
jgi:hypothetical protein